MTRTLIVTLESDTVAGLDSAEHRIFDGLRWLHPHVPYHIERRQAHSAAAAPDRIKGPWNYLPTSSHV